MKMQAAKLNCAEFECNETISSRNVIHLMVNGAANKISHWREMSKQRNQLSTLSEGQLNDMGLTAHDVKTESTKLFWQ